MQIKFVKKISVLIAFTTVLTLLGLVTGCQKNIPADIATQTTLDPAVLDGTSPPSPSPSLAQMSLATTTPVTTQNINPSFFSWQLLTATNCFLNYVPSPNTPALCANNTGCTTENRQQIRQDILPFVLILRSVQMNLFNPPSTEGEGKAIYDNFRSIYGGYLDDFYRAEQPADVDMDKYYPLDQCIRSAFNQTTSNSPPNTEI
jgi:hypothetical protein